MIVGMGFGRGGDGVFPVRMVTSAFPSSDIDSLTCDEIRLRASADSEALLAPFVCPVEGMLDVGNDGGRPLLVSS